MNATVDIGNNLTALVERLAAQIGTTADQVFPWYVQQQLIVGWTHLIMLALGWVAGLTLIACFYRKANGHTGEGMAPVIAGTILCILTLMFTIGESSSALGQVLNPQFGAMHALAFDIGRMAGK